MNCNPDLLQAYLDRQIEPKDAAELQKHLAGCLACRKELSQLRLLWLELGQQEAPEIPPELPFLRQQVIAEAKRASQSTGNGIGFWESQKLAYESLKYAYAYLPGAGRLKEITQTAGRGLPRAMFNTAVRLLRKRFYR